MTQEGRGGPASLEQRRLAELAAFWVSGSNADARLDPIIAEARALFSAGMGFITVVDESQLIFKACSGIDIDRTSKIDTFCSHAILSDGVFLVPDARLDPRFAQTPFVTQPPFIRFYAGAPLITGNGYRLGTLCVADTSPRPEARDGEYDGLRSLADQVMETFNLRRADFARSTSVNFANATDLSLISIDPTGRIEFVNPSALALFGYSHAEMIGSPIEIIIPERMRGAHSAGLERVAMGGEARLKGKTVEVDARRKDGTEFPIEIAVSTWRDERGLSAGAIIKDISERRERDTRLMRLAGQDTLTGLHNRHRFTDILKTELERGMPMAVMLIDLDGFKDINDTQGHGVGDSLIQAIGVRLPYVLSRNATIARFGGDEFAVLLPDVGDPVIAAREALALVRAFEEPFSLGGHMFDLGASIGVALGPAHGDDDEELIASADFALYRAKQAGGRTSRMFDPSMRNETLARRVMRDELLHALRNDELVLYYQPQVYLGSERILGAEALIRWQHPERGLLQPAAFLPALEQTSLALDVGWWVLDEACRQQALWRQAGHYNLKMSINLFPAQLKSPHLVRKISDAMRAYRLDPSMLELEVTETIALHDDDRSFEVLTELRGLGIGIAFDDFGTGYASLSSLQRYPLTTLKIDKGFVRDIINKPRDAAITRALIAMSTDLGLQTIAEGIETREQEEAIRALGCPAGQGYLFGKPMPASDMDIRLAGLRREA
ncbi:putative bifunctional diguanylate cyclase/phosphodiesterase [Pararhizobium sp.]|uniref:putative bifunctional diguanylate cyclase/phosphodiesterase n=1 Tax=Pararhizobium sp. TaxID=1977563 RepID=UPI00272419E0|nr:EAL domain-containing protein [Pararhizobium sp.]MDO9418804.1 EAL domain-containing protein [Pararhizobium sp.]